MSELTIRQARVEDLEALAAFMREQSGSNVDAKYLQHWYLNNPSHSASLIVGWINGAIVGMATTNDHYFEREGEQPCLVAMPQKVLTDASVRGKGVFGKLYNASETAGLERGVALFLTVTNEASTPIFLKRFGYQRLPSPQLIALAARPGHVQYSEVTEALPAYIPPRGSNWRMRKDPEHFRWRYASSSVSKHRIMRIAASGAPLGTAVLRPLRKGGLPFLLLMDLLPERAELGSELLRAVRRIAWEQRAVGVLALGEEHLRPWVRQQLPRFARNSGFNLLVKGKDAGQTKELTSRSFELAFGDLDFF